MPRGRSPSPRRDRDGRDRRRSRSRERERRHRDRHRRSRSRSPYRKRSRSPRRRSPYNRRSRSPSIEHISGPSVSTANKPFKVTKKKVNEEELKDMDPEDADMMRMMGFSGFDSTKGKPVEGNDVGASNIILKRKFRQYMNRRGGFNRPLDFIA